jgi:hypothetical protein
MMMSNILRMVALYQPLGSQKMSITYLSSKIANFAKIATKMHISPECSHFHKGRNARRVCIAGGTQSGASK